MIHAMVQKNVARCNNELRIYLLRVTRGNLFHAFYHSRQLHEIAVGLSGVKRIRASR